MNDRPDDPEIPLGPFPTALPSSPFPPLEDVPPEPWLETPEPEPRVVDRLEGMPLTTEVPDRATASEAAGVNPLLVLGRFAFPPGEPPDDEGLAARDRRWTSRVLVVAAAFLLIFNIASVQNWARQQPPGWVTTTVKRLADVWSEQTVILGADRPREAVRSAYEAGRDARWSVNRIAEPAERTDRASTRP